MMKMVVTFAALGLAAAQTNEEIAAITARLDEMDGKRFLPGDDADAFWLLIGMILVFFM